MKQRKAFADFKEEWTALNRKLRIMLPNYSTARRVKVGDDTWTVVASMGCELASRPNITFLEPPDWKPPTLTDAEGKPVAATLPEEVEQALNALNEEMKAFFEGAGCFPEGDNGSPLTLVLPEKKEVPDESASC